MEGNNLFDKFQSGFRKNHSTETALLRVTNDILMSADFPCVKLTILILLDLSADFGTVDHTALLNQLRNGGCQGETALNWFSTYSLNRVIKATVDNFSSSTALMSCGVPQGSVLASIFFCLYLLPLGHVIHHFTRVLPLSF